MPRQVAVERGPLTVSVPDLPVGEYASIVAHWLRYQLARPLRRQSWSSGCRIVLADTGDVIAAGGRRRRPHRAVVDEPYPPP
ncbi:hypothetical protein KZZ52_35645 [Dactylosporangium sp. AC04546]|uniref:hypothetical protein n=1 Tax=Dactylosporangium sp. AC04546 TaxID=2862460 RepID=UPI001EDD6993|nr:hypothetical protein [Dactylosporangium sp. AC04546]WVK79305.1 hypothetical protein KZZ52_35645 [Dactylosporangium sp. AC04546]